MRLFVTLVAAALTVSASAAAQQASQFEQQVRQQLSSIGERLRANGYEPTHHVYTGQLKEEANERVAVQLRRGVRYALVGVCDQDCGDLDLRLFDPSGREIGRDVEKDDTPVVEITAEKSGEYTLRIEMAECSDEPCAYGFGVFAAGQDEFERQVRQQLEEAGRNLARDGFRLTHQIFTGALEQRELENVTFELDRGGTYVVLGVCDTDCRDLDLKLLNAAGRQIDSDVEEDDSPVVAVAPTRSERYTVQAIMAQCGKGPCRYGLGVFRK
ncbi:MAG TPA: hypothetical protein VM364_13785 [Vicinamibacterales bacterium]|nr:hypothetical protein [Vicinamibacterales bacterium]